MFKSAILLISVRRKETLRMPQRFGRELQAITVDGLLAVAICCEESGRIGTKTRVYLD